MAKLNLDVSFDPGELRAHARNDANMVLRISGPDDSLLWCECDVSVLLPLSLAQDRELAAGRSRIGLVGSGKTAEKRVRLYTVPNNYSGTYVVNLVMYAYGEDGVIEERLERKLEIECK